MREEDLASSGSGAQQSLAALRREKLLKQINELAAELAESGEASAERVFRIEEAQRARRGRANFFNPRLFADPAWDMLLELYAADVSYRKIAVFQLCAASGVPATTALRWIDALIKEGLVTRSPDPRDGRRILVCLTPSARQAMADYFHSLPAGLCPI